MKHIKEYCDTVVLKVVKLISMKILKKQLIYTKNELMRVGNEI